MYTISSIKIGGIPRPNHSDINKVTLLEELIENWTQNGVIVGIEKSANGLRVFEHGILNALIEYDLTKIKY